MFVQDLHIALKSHKFRHMSSLWRLNEDLTEAIASAYDLGHPPFGHAGEDALNELMRKNNGFEHNQQSLRIVEF